MSKTTLATLLFFLLLATPGCAICEWLGQGIAGQYYGAAERSEHWRESTGHDDWRQSDFDY
ncbi:hypothetical protein M4951_24355 [Blastopirellula sp. J2-11]|uniref:hypothetical protein n=1 Tax=Blastopirellula sp. J2-11 TaxID=2943192 RepID=UPI0021C5CB03|nr:hypothetical protein [Blastopirellula sp. J2-11]UUO06465.1 hypothetical protein M4951_24355 [Blastopirellula sp. J2-11]